MKSLHIVQGGITNGDKDFIERAAKEGIDSKSPWIAPKCAQPGDDCVIYIGGYGFFATAKIRSAAKPRDDWPNRYGARITQIKLISPPISLGTITNRLPSLNWARYPRSITTPKPQLAQKIRELVKKRRKTKFHEHALSAFETATLADLRRLALLKARHKTTATERKRIERMRSTAIKRYVLARAEGTCEGCDCNSPFQRPDGSPYLEPHHTTRVADEGPDHPARVIALCPNCHRRAHHAIDAAQFNASLKRKLRSLEAQDS